jgi:hypothetical protein
MDKGENRNPFGFDDPKIAAFLRARDNIRGVKLSRHPRPLRPIRSRKAGPTPAYSAARAC